MWQTNYVAARLEAAWPHVRCEIHPFVTQGDRRLDSPLPEIGGKGLFTSELEAALHSHAIDLAVHSLKDLPVDDSPGLTVGAIPPRADVRDVLIAQPGVTLDSLPAGARVGTSSLRRQAQLAAYRPDLRVEPIRGNVDTRLRKVLAGDYAAAVMAAAGLARLGLEKHICAWLDLHIMLPAPGQGALGVQCRADDQALLALLARLDDPATRAAVIAERRLLKELGGGCSAPVAALATLDASGRITLTARVASLDGQSVRTVTVHGMEPHAVAIDAAAQLSAQGATAILEEARRRTETRAPARAGQTAQPLTGQCVLITRAAEQASSLRTLLEAAGATVLLLPAVQIMPLVADSTASPGPVTVLDDVDFVVFTSANAVRVFVQMYPCAAQRLAAGGVVPTVVAVGPATRTALTEAGIPVQIIPTQYAAAALPVALGDVAGKRILLPRSALGDTQLPESLRAGGASVIELALYTTVPTEPDAETVAAVLAGPPPDYVIFTSPSTVTGLLHWLASDAVLAARVASATAVCIGPTTAQALAGTAWRHPIVAETHTAEGIVDAIIRRLQR